MISSDNIDIKLATIANIQTRSHANINTNNTVDISICTRSKTNIDTRFLINSDINTSNSIRVIPMRILILV